jgi:RNA polymerase sigma factor (sigma-70 family)
MTSRIREYEDVYAGAYGRLVSQLTLLTDSIEEAQDAVQEALFRAWLKWDKVGSYEDPEGWVRRVAINVATSRWRKLRRLVGVPRNFEGRAAPSVELTEESLDLLAVMRKMPQRQREALTLFYLLDLSIQEVAEEMRIRLGTAKGLVSRGRDSLRTQMEETRAEGDTHVR